MALSPDPGDFTTVAKVQEYLAGAAVPVDLIQRLITGVSGWMAAYMNRDIVQSVYVETLDGTGTASIRLNQYPVISVTSLTVGGLAVDPANFASRRQMISITDGSKFPRGKANVKVVYTAGFASIPPELDAACVRLVAWRYAEKDHLTQTSKVMGAGGGTISYDMEGAPKDVFIILNNWRRVV